MGRRSVFLSLASAILIGYLSLTTFSDNNPPELEEFYWGKSKAGAKDEDKSVRPFTIKVDDKVIADLKKRLQLELSPEGNRLKDTLPGQGFQYGFNSNYIRKVGDYWLNKYDWKAREKQFNKFSHHKTTLQGLDVHFIHAKSNNNKKYNVTMPLLLIHGWPGSVLEFQKILPMLTDPVDDAINFEVVVPSIPGFGFSEAPSKPGFGSVQAAQLFLRLMQRLGHERFYVQGGDWGSVIATDMAAIYHKNVIATHLNMCFNSHPRLILRYIGALIASPLFYTSEEAGRMLPPFKAVNRLWKESGYLHLQATRPDTVAIALSNSPLGLASYILEKFAVWTNSDAIVKEDGGLSENFTLDELLDNVMLYWATNTIGSSMRLYRESFSEKQQEYQMHKVPTYVPSACQASRHDYLTQAEALLTDKYPQMMKYTTLEKGGHFTAMQLPQVVAEDVLSFFLHVEQMGLSALHLRKL